MRRILDASTLVACALILAFGFLFSSTSAGTAQGEPRNNDSTVDTPTGVDSQEGQPSVDTAAIIHLFGGSTLTSSPAPVSVVEAPQPATPNRNIKYVGTITDASGSTMYWFKEAGMRSPIALSPGGQAVQGWSMVRISPETITLKIDGYLYEVRIQP